MLLGIPGANHAGTWQAGSLPLRSSPALLLGRRRSSTMDQGGDSGVEVALNEWGAQLSSRSENIDTLFAELLDTGISRILDCIPKVGGVDMSVHRIKVWDATKAMMLGLGLDSDGHKRVTRGVRSRW